MAGKRSESRVRKQLRTRHTAIPNTSDSAQSHILSRITLVICTTLHIVLPSTAQVTIVGFVKPSFLQRRGPTAIKTVPAIDRQLARNIFIFRPKTNTLSYIPTATTTTPAYRTPHCETSQRHSFRKNIAQGPAFSLPSHNPLASQHVETASVSRRWPFELKSW